MVHAVKVLSVLALFLGLAQPAQAQADPGQIAAACIAAMEREADHAVVDIGGITGSTVARIRQLDADGAPDAAIIAAGRAGHDAVGLRRTVAQRTIASLKDDCVFVLRRLEAPPALIARVATAGRAQIGVVNAAAQTAHNAIGHAVRDALD